MKGRRAHRFLGALACGMVGLGAGVAACGSERHGGPAPVDTVAATTGSGGSGGAGGGAPAPAKRTVMQRNPFGNVARADNLLWDGDFEWRSPFADQYGWYGAESLLSPFELPALAFAERCRSGLKCAVIPAGHLLIGLSVGAGSDALAAGFWAHVGSGDSCDGVDAVVVDVTVQEAGALPPALARPDGGWCRYEGLVTDAPGAPFLLILNERSEPIIVDDAVIAPTTLGASSMRAAPRASLADMPAVVAAVRRVTEPRRPPPNAAARALKRAMRRVARPR